MAQILSRSQLNSKKLFKSAVKRTVIFRGFEKGSENKPLLGTGILLKNNIVVTNEHILRDYIKKNGKDYVFSIFTTNLKKQYDYQDVKLLKCDQENDICILRIDGKVPKKSFTLDERIRSFKKNKLNPTGLYKGEKLFLIGSCAFYPKMKEAKFVNYKMNIYNETGNKNRWYIPAIEISDPEGFPVLCGGDSGGPVFDDQLYLYGMNRDTLTSSSKERDLAVPINIIKKFYLKYKDNIQIMRIKTLKKDQGAKDYFSKIN